jgi:hypothetical protein
MKIRSPEKIPSLASSFLSLVLLVLVVGVPYVAEYLPGLAGGHLVPNSEECFRVAKLLFDLIVTSLILFSS